VPVHERKFDVINASGACRAVHYAYSATCRTSRTACLARNYYDSNKTTYKVLQSKQLPELLILYTLLNMAG